MYDDPKRYFIFEFGTDPKTGKTTMALKGPTGTSKIYTEGGPEVTVQIGSNCNDTDISKKRRSKLCLYGPN